ncbi:hypothetical protein BT67DRAFT_391309 [Trichocladium antarcticum]|uniref:Zn(2)-C6 fungal-type domain-containing protein n=1 Tax=Trichocladium antarcticum TaxID=1450529 RepID=A0AAN6ZA13_9PEZI|nr:hypothetical protein BT67DRAFT_391309 [Trichocladium antarcticum]
MPLSGPPKSGSASLSRSLAKFGCVSCREHHLKCDRVTPTCGRCLNARRECRPPGLKIRVTAEHKFKFTKKQKWVKTPRRLIFIDESKTAAQDASSPDSGPDEFDDAAWGFPITASKDSSHQTLLLPGRGPPSRPRSPTDRFLISSPKWPLTNEVEAYLFRHFVEELARWLDLCDPKQTFEIEVPRRAKGCPVLLNAIFALSARHLGQTRNEKYYNDLAGGYNAACLKDLTENTKHQSGWTEDRFAAAIILQVVEEINAGDIPADADDSGHLMGMYGFVNSRSLEPESIRAASFWVGLRQEIYIAVRKGQQVGMNLAYQLVDRSLGTTDDYTWANRAVVHCADVLNFCFGSDRGQLRRWNELDGWNQDWTNGRPDSFDPIFRQDQGSAPFPEIWYHRSCQGRSVIGVQHHLLAKLFLLDHHLNFGSRDRVAANDVQKCIRDRVREICGIGLGNLWSPPGMFTACMAIAAFGEYFRVPQDQREILRILEKTQNDHARPTERVRQKMLRAWGLGPEYHYPQNNSPLDLSIGDND